MITGAHFQIVEPRAIWFMIERLLDGQPPPPSAFDTRSDAERVWIDACRRAHFGDSRAAAVTAFQIAIRWSAATLPSVFIRDFGLSCQPRGMDPAFLPFPSLFHTAQSLFTPLFTRRPDLPLDMFGDLVEHGVGVRISCDATGGTLMRRYCARLPSPLRERVLPLLAIVRAAQRLDRCVLESVGVLDAGCDDTSWQSWPGLDRFGVAGGPLSPGEWEALAETGVHSFGDLEDIVDRITRTDPRDEEIRRPIYALLGRVQWRSWLVADDLLPPVLVWLERAMAAGIEERTAELHRAAAGSFFNRREQHASE